MLPFAGAEAFAIGTTSRGLSKLPVTALVALFAPCSNLRKPFADASETASSAAFDLRVGKA